MGYVFLDPELLVRALTHSSYANERRTEDNERLEFVGDAVLQLAASAMLAKRFPKAREGELSRLRSRLVNTGALAEIARSLEIGPLLRLGVGEHDTGGRDRESVLADATEALLGAIFTEVGFAEAGAIAQDWIRDRLKILDDRRVDLQWKDPKSRLQEVLQQDGGSTPVYETLGRTGPDHEPVYTVEVVVHEADGRRALASAQGRSKKEAEKAAARAALEALEP
ncbi:MAG: ribonuclease III [Alphaproteobacteria bacterium]|nr:ribonuclease III [Alphaproteobacteria bacterium]MCB9690520.1 ribonuclease III [Alphaproteobacteria bacterium]